MKALTGKSAAAVVSGLVGLVATLSNDHSEFGDIVNVPSVIEKIGYDDSYLYGTSYALFLGSLIALGYNALTGNFFKKEKKD